MIGAIFTTYIYQPFFNLLVLIYYGLQNVPALPHRDMGIAVIIFTVALRIILLPISLASHRSEKERRDLEHNAAELRRLYESEPLKLKREMRRLFGSNRRVVIAEGIDLFIQVTIAIMLWRIFATGLGGADIHLLYKFMPDVPQPYDLKFLGTYDLTHPHIILNIIQSLVIFAVEVLAVLTSPFPTNRRDVYRMQFFLPVVSYIIFAFLPAGKKLFVITTLTFSFFLTLFRFIYHLLYKFLLNPEKPTPAEPTTVDTPAT